MLHRHGNTKTLVEVLDLWHSPGLLARVCRTHVPNDLLDLLHNGHFLCTT